MFCLYAIIHLVWSISAGANGGPRSRVCTRLTLHLAPHQHQRKFFEEWSIKLEKFQAILSTFSGRGQFFLHPKSYFFDLIPQAKLQNPILTPFEEKVTEAERGGEREKKKKAVNSGHASGARSSHQNKVAYRKSAS